PIWIAEYVLAGYGTGAIMAVPCGDQRDFLFAKHFNISVTNIIGKYFNGEEANPTKDAVLENSGFLNGLLMKDAIRIAINKIEELGIGKKKVNYRMRDAGFSRQRYWGEPFPIIWSDGIAIPLDAEELPLELPHVDKYGPGPSGEGPLANLTDWVELSPSSGGGRRETSTMPGYAGSSWYFLRYMDPHNKKTFCDRKLSDYWNQVDLYIGGTEHAVGHLLYSRMWTKVLFDLGLIGFDEPYKKLLNQGMITGVSKFVYMMAFTVNIGYKIVAGFEMIPPIYVSKDLLALIRNDQDLKLQFDAVVQNIFKDFGSDPNIVTNSYDFHRRRTDVKLVDGEYLDMIKFREDSELSKNAYFICNDFKVNSPKKNRVDENVRYLCDSEVEKMSKSKLNTINPNDLCDRYGADTFRMYEMFLGPVEASKPWDTKGIEGVHRFLRKLWRLFYDEVKGPIWTSSVPSPSERAGGEVTNAELKVLHRTIKKIEEDTERFSFNTAVSTFMICVNELADMKCHKKEILQPLLILLTPYAPHISEELYQQLKSSQVLPTGEDLGGAGASVLDASFPAFDGKYLVESSKEYPISVNGKLRTNINIALDASPEEVEKIVLANEVMQKWLEGKAPKKIIFVKGKMVNVVL
ncbi:MAG TPA: class I tRNA ligase family protein, partial [Ferruginibacter sp.]|nr:class I tRNA ligase family protein [Ferruginibacter sp.]